MRELGATVVPVKSGSRTLKDAVNEARSAGDDADAMTIP
jgi:tryptophan synthase beta subunit